MRRLIVNKTKVGNILLGCFLNDKSYNTLVNFDCDVYCETGRLLAKFRKNVLSKDKLECCVKNLRGSIKKTDNRGVSAGKIDGTKTRHLIGVVENYKYKPINKNGKISKFKVGNLVNSSVVGYMDRTVLAPYCRKTSFVKNNFEKFSKAIPFIKEVDFFYSKLLPEKWNLQSMMAKQTDLNYIISGTSFTTVTINKDFQTAVHKDSGDFKDGFGNLSVYKTDGVKGGYFCLPEWEIAFDLDNCDLLLVDVHQYHGNTPIIKNTEKDERISFVMYFRENSINCLSPSKELERVKIADNKT